MSSSKYVVAHITHEAVQKVGGIGAVLQGLLTSPAYLNSVARDVLVGPLFTTEGQVEDRLGRSGEVLYSSLDGLTKHAYANQFQAIEEKYSVEIVYGRRHLVDEASGVRSAPEVVLIELSRMDVKEVNAFKGRLYTEFGVESDRYEHSWEYELWTRLALPALACLRAIGAVTTRTQDCIIVSHEFMGMPTALAALLDPRHLFRTVFYAHEVAPMRRIVEQNPGHDTMFYNVLRNAKPRRLYVQDVFGSQRDNFKYALVTASKHCDNVMAVGDSVIEELRFLSPEFEHVDIDLAYNGLPAYEITVDEKLASRERLRRYAVGLLGEPAPDFVFTHVTRTALSKGLWRDVRVLEYIEQAFRKTGQGAVLFVLSSEVPPRRPQDVYHMEYWWKWPVAHREGLPDMSGGEAMFYTAVQEFNARSRNVKVVFVNQFGWDRQRCGARMPADMEFMDIRKGTDVEFGQSIYEPFGIAQLEPLSFGGLCVISSMCGCAGFLSRVNAPAGGVAVKNVIIADYTKLPHVPLEVASLLRFGRAERDVIEASVAEGVAQEVLSRLPKNREEMAELIRVGCELAKKMSWEVVSRDYVLPGFARACRKRHVRQIA